MASFECTLIRLIMKLMLSGSPSPSKSAKDKKYVKCQMGIKTPILSESLRDMVGKYFFSAPMLSNFYHCHFGVGGVSMCHSQQKQQSK